VALRDDSPGAGLDESGGVVVDPLASVVDSPLGQPGFRVAARVAEVVEQDHRVLGQAHVRGDRVLAEVLVRVVATAGHGVEPEAVLGHAEERVAVLAGPAVAVAHVDHDCGAVERLPDHWPGRLGGVDPDDIGGVGLGQRRRRLRLFPIAVRGGPGRADDHDDLGLRLCRKSPHRGDRDE
jgi:hypothetical protein